MFGEKKDGQDKDEGIGAFWIASGFALFVAVCVLVAFLVIVRAL